MDIPLTKEALLPYVRDFINVYSNRPIKENNGGMMSVQCFYTWYMLKILKPTVVIESGIWYGQSTWLIEQACPDAKIISIDINLSFQKYKSKRAAYITTDFNSVDWTTILGKQCATTVAFIDDHQNCYERLLHAHKHKLSHVIFEDNYPTTQGDVLSLKKIFSDNYYILDRNRSKTRHAIPEDYQANVNAVCDYFEFPPIYLDKTITRWGDSFADHKTKAAIFTSIEDPALEILKADQLNYNFICLVKIKT